MSHLKIISLNTTPVFEMRMASDGSLYGTGGVDFVLLQILSQKFPFNYELTTMENLVYGTVNEKGEWTGMVKKLIDKEADLAMGWMANTYVRSQVVDFSFPYMLENDIFITLAPRILERDFPFLDPFQLPVWLLLIISVLFSALALFLLGTDASNLGRKKRSYHQMWIYEMDKLIALLLSQGTYTHYRSGRSRAFMYPWTVSKLVLVFCYLSTLLSFLMVPLREPPLDSVKQLRDAVVAGRWRVAAFKGTSQLGNILAAERGMVRDLADNLRRHPENVLLNHDDLYRRVDSGERLAVVVFRLFFVLASSLKGLDRYHMSRESLGVSLVSLAFARGFPHMERVNRIIHRISQSGLYSKAVNDRIYQFALKAPPPLPPQERRPLAIPDIKRAGQLLLSGYAAASLCLFVEIVRGRH